MKRMYAVAALLAALAVGWGSAAAGAASQPSSAPGPQKADRTGRAIVLVSPAAREPLSDAIASAGLEAAHSVPELGAAAVELPPGGIAALRSELSATPGVVGIKPEYRRELRAVAPLVPNDPAFATPDPGAPGGDLYQWHLARQGFPGAWARSAGEGADVAVIDTGIDADNPDLGPRLVAAVDQHGGVTSGPATVDENGHGTHVSGLACAEGNNGYGGASAGFRCNLIVEKTDLTDISIAASIVDATDRGAEVINMSFGGPGRSIVIRDAIDYAWARDVVMVAAASNEAESNQGIPAEYLQPTGSAPNLYAGMGLVVTAAEHDDTAAHFDPGFGPGISLAAYGAGSAQTRGIFSNFPPQLTELELGLPGMSAPCLCRTSFAGDDRFAHLQGTSMATPQVAGAAALITSRKPSMHAEKVIRIIKEEASGDQFSDALGWGILNAKRAVKAAAKKKGKKKKG